MPDLTGFVSVRNRCGTTIQDISLSLVVGGEQQALIQAPTLSDSFSSMNKKYSVPGNAITEWHVAFTRKGTRYHGSTACQTGPADNNQMLKIELKEAGFTVVPRVSAPASGTYDIAPPAPTADQTQKKATKKAGD